MDKRNILKESKTFTKQNIMSHMHVCYCNLFLMLTTSLIKLSNILRTSTVAVGFVRAAFTFLNNGAENPDKNEQISKQVDGQVSKDTDS